MYDQVATPTESDESIEARLTERFEILDALTDATCLGHIRSLIVSGPTGLGKSFSIERSLKAWDPTGKDYSINSGYARATGLYRLFYEFRREGQVLVFDDIDSIFQDENSLNLLKKVCDSMETRTVSWLTEGVPMGSDGAPLPRSFQFEGSIIFITNLKFDQMISSGHKLRPHLEAMLSRSHYVDLSIHTRREYLVRIKQVVFDEGMLDFLDAEGQLEVMEFIWQHANSLRELSLRIALKIASLRQISPIDWRKLARVTCCKSVPRV